MAKVKLEHVRLAFPSLFEATRYDEKAPYAYSGVFLFEPDSKNHKKILTAIDEAAKEEWPKEYKKILENANDDSKMRLIGDGNKKSYDGYKDMLYIRATRKKDKKPVLVLDQKPKNPDGTDNILTADDGRPYGGCYVNATIELWAQDNKHGKTIRAQLLAVQFKEDADAFAAGSVGTSDEFDDVSDTGDEDDLVE